MFHRLIVSVLRFVPQDIAQNVTHLNGPAHEPTDQPEHFPTNTTKQPPLAANVVEAEAAAATDAPETATVASNVARSSVTATPDPSVVRGDASTSPAPAFEGLHTASLVAGPGGVNVLAVGLTVLQKVYPAVHGRLKEAVTERCVGMEMKYIAVSLKTKMDQRLTAIDVFVRVMPP